MIRFGSMSTVLLLGALYGGLFAALLAWTRINARANRFLALLLIVIALQLLPYIIGYAGFYDAFPWLSYLPYEASLAFGPLLYGYVCSLSGSEPRRAWRYHFVPVAVQMAYYCAIFPLPLDFKNHWNDTVHVPYIVPLEQLATFASMAVYWVFSLRHYRAYQTWLADSVSDREDHHIVWVRNFLIALGVTLLLWVGLVVFERAVTPLNYFEQFPFYVWLTVLAYYLGTEGYRNASHRYPVWRSEEAIPLASADAVAEVSAVPVARLPREPIDWVARGEKWRDRLVAEEWWREPDLSLDLLARRLGTNTSDLSRAINEGLGQNFNELVNRLRVQAVQQALEQPGAAGRGLLDLALEAGFSSKASFNRCFKLYAGVTPSAYRSQR